MCNQIDVSDIEELAGDIEGIARILLSLGEHQGGCDHEVIFQFLGSRLFEYWRELDALINSEEEEKAKKAPVVDAYSLTMLQEALYKLNGNDPAGAARCANEAIKQLEISGHAAREGATI
jgi:hypothetical protein